MGGSAPVRRAGATEIPTGGLVGTDRVVPVLKMRGRLLFRKGMEGLDFAAGRLAPLALLAGGSLELSTSSVLKETDREHTFRQLEQP